MCEDTSIEFRLKLIKLFYLTPYLLYLNIGSGKGLM